MRLKVYTFGPTVHRVGEQYEVHGEAQFFSQPEDKLEDVMSLKEIVGRGDVAHAANIVRAGLSRQNVMRWWREQKR